jgi:hypothetical protein
MAIADHTTINRLDRRLITRYSEQAGDSSVAVRQNLLGFFGIGSRRGEAGSCR